MKKIVVVSSLVVALCADNLMVQKKEITARSTPTSLITFSANSPAKASEVNQNFEYLLNRITQLEATIETMQGGSSSLSSSSSSSSSSSTSSSDNFVESDFLGYYKMLDTKRSYEEYHGYIHLFGSNSGWALEVANGTRLTNSDANSAGAYGEFPISWHYTSQSNTIVLDWTVDGQYPQYGNFSGTMQGDLDKFTLTGYWYGENAGEIELTRVTRNEYYCIVSGGFIYQDGKCMYIYSSN
jgi:hypothetical protein